MPQARGWFEGTLDVISGISAAPRAATPTRPQRISMSAPSSPIMRLPSQDSMDRSMHNESLHGKSTAQQIKDLKAANARLTAQTASIEADFMNQLNQATQHHESEMMQLQQRVQQKEKTLQMLEQRYNAVEIRSKEKDDALARLREESAFYRHTISELKAAQSANSEANASVSDSIGDSGEKRELLKRIAELEQLLEASKTMQIADKNGGNSMQQLQQALNGAQDDWKKQDELLKQKIKSLQNFQGDTSAQIRARDDLLEKLCQQVLAQDQQWTTLTFQLDKLQQQSREQEQYHRDEVEDLRTLNDAQEQELSHLRLQLEEAAKEIEWRSQALDDRSREVDSSHDIEEASKLVASLQSQLDEANLVASELQKELESAQAKYKDDVSNLEEQIRAVGEKSSAEEAAKSEQNNTELSTLERSHADTVYELTQAKETLTSIRREKTRLVQSHQREVAKLNLEMQKLKSDCDKKSQLLQSYKSYGASSSKDDSSVNESKIKALNTEIESLKAEIQELKSAQLQHEHSSEETKKLEESVKLLQSKLEAVEQEKEIEIADLKAKLKDRDTTISSLVKSTGALEEQLSLCRSESKALRTKLYGNMGDENAELFLSQYGHSSEEVKVLREKMNVMRETEENLSKDVFRLKRQLQASRQECSKLKNQLNEDSMDGPRGLGGDEASSANSISTSQRYIQERDDAIAKLVKQTMSQEKTIDKLHTKLRKLEAMRNSPTNHADPAVLLAEMEQLKKETEMFAGQVIEQDEEIESLTRTIEERDIRIAILESQVRTTKESASNASDLSKRVIDLEAEIDELRESREVVQSELRLLRRKTRGVDSFEENLNQAKSKQVDLEREIEKTRQMLDLTDKENNEMKEMLQKERTQKEAAVKELAALTREYGEANNLSEQVQKLQDELNEKEKKIVELESNVASSHQIQKAHSVDEMELEELHNERDMLKKNLSNQTIALDTARNTIRELEQILAEKTSTEASAFEDEKEELLAEIENLTHEVQDLQQQLKDLEEQKTIIDDFKGKLEMADEAREESEKSIVDIYERKLSLLKLDKDVLIDKLRKELTEEKGSKAGQMSEMAQQLEHYEKQNEMLRQQTALELQQRETRIFALEHTLAAQEQLVGNMKTEMDHLQGSMVNTTNGRREEFENMQQEIVDLTATATRQEREISSLRMQLDDQKITHQMQVDKLHETIDTLEHQSTEAHRTASDLQMELRMQEVKDRLEKLRWRNSVLQEENEALRDRLVEVSDYDSNAELEQKCEEQSLLIEDLQKQLISSKEESVKLQRLEKELAEAKACIITPFPLPKSAPTISSTTTENETKPPKSTSSSLAVSSQSPDRSRKSRKSSEPGVRKGLFSRLSGKGGGGHSSSETKEAAKVNN